MSETEEEEFLKAAAAGTRTMDRAATHREVIWVDEQDSRDVAKKLESVGQGRKADDWEAKAEARGLPTVEQLKLLGNQLGYQPQVIAAK